MLGRQIGSHSIIHSYSVNSMLFFGVRNGFNISPKLFWIPEVRVQTFFIIIRFGITSFDFTLVSKLSVQSSLFLVLR